MNRLAAILMSLAFSACSALAAPSGPPPAGLARPGPLPGQAAGPETCPPAGEADCMLEAAWEAAVRLGPDKLARLRPAFAETVAISGNPGLAASWQVRLAGVRPPSPPVNFARQTAEAAIAAHGWEGFFQRARQGHAPLNIGRPEIMAAAIDLAPNAIERQRLIDMMFSFAGAPKPGTAGRISPDDFERATFAHLLAEQMMRDCKLTGFRRARGLTSAPDSVRYALWDARITGGAGRLAGAVRRGDGTDDTRHVRQALEGYGAILAHGYCTR